MVGGGLWGSGGGRLGLGLMLLFGRWRRGEREVNGLMCERVIYFMHHDTGMMAKGNVAQEVMKN